MNTKPTSTPVQLEYKNVYIRSALPSDIEDVGDNMREIDKLECLLSSGTRPRDAIRTGLENDFHTWSICSNKTKKPLACFGVGPLMPNETNYIWLLCTDDLIKESGSEFAKASKAWVKFIVNHYQLPCVNEVHTENTLALRWLKWCGAIVEEPKENDFSLFTIHPNE